MTIVIEPMTEWRDRQFITTVYLAGRFGYFQYVRYLDLIGGGMSYTLAACLRFRRSNIASR